MLILTENSTSIRNVSDSSLFSKPTSMNEEKKISLYVITTIDLHGLVAFTPSQRHFYIQVFSYRNRFEPFVRILCEHKPSYVMLFWKVALPLYLFLFENSLQTPWSINYKSFSINKPPVPIWRTIRLTTSICIKLTPICWSGFPLCPGGLESWTLFAFIYSLKNHQ